MSNYTDAEVDNMVRRTVLQNSLVGRAEALANAIAQTLDTIDVALDQVHKIVTDAQLLQRTDLGPSALIQTALRTTDHDRTAQGNNTAGRRHPTPTAHPGPTRETERHWPLAGPTPAGE